MPPLPAIFCDFPRSAEAAQEPARSPQSRRVCDELLPRKAWQGVDDVEPRSLEIDEDVTLRLQPRVILKRSAPYLDHIAAHRGHRSAAHCAERPSITGRLLAYGRL